MVLVPQNIGEYIMGHKSKQSNKIHAKYGNGRNVRDLVKHITAIVAAKEWGYFDEYDDWLCILKPYLLTALSYHLSSLAVGTFSLFK